MSEELQQRHAQTQSELQAVRAQISTLGRSVQLANLTKTQIKASAKDTDPVWQAVGRMFVLTTVDDYNAVVEKREEQVQEQLNGLDKKQKYFEVTLENMAKAMKEVSV